MRVTVTLLHEPKRKRPWIVRWYGELDSATGKQKRCSTAFRYIREARAFKASKEAALRQGGTREPTPDVQLGRLIEEFLKARVAKLSYSAQQAYRHTMDQLRDYFGQNTPLLRIDQRRAETFIASRQRCNGAHEALASWTIAHHIKHCRALFGAAVEWGYMTHNPFRRPTQRGSSPLAIRGRSRPWQHITPPEFMQFLDAVQLPQRRAGYWLMYGCGLRAGEVYGLTIDRIDLAQRVVRIENRAATADIPPFVVKGDAQSTASKARSVPIPVAAMADVTKAVRLALKSGGFIALTPERFATVQEYWRLCRAGKPWAGRQEHRPWLNRDMCNNWLRSAKLYLRNAGIKLTAPFTLHTFRKSFAQNHANAGTPPRTLSELLGHSDVSMTLEFYNSVTDANRTAAAATVDRLFKFDGQTDAVTREVG